MGERGSPPPEGKRAVVMSMLKPGTEASRLGSYGPTALTAVLCKIMERRVTDRLVHFLERKGSFVPYQSGFRFW